MADPGLSLLDDNPQATPLDLLINAISGSGGYSFAADDGSGATGGAGDDATVAAATAGDAMVAYLDGEGGAGASTSSGDPGPSTVARVVEAAATTRKRGFNDEDADDATRLRVAKIARTLTSHFAPRAAPSTAPSSRAFSTIEVWHPKTGQKSYGKERRMLNPPPTLRVIGPLAPLVSTVTLSSHPNPDPLQGNVVFSSQTHRLGEQPEPVPDLYPRSTKKAERDERRRRVREAAAKTGWGGTLPWERSRNNLRDRSELESGITFPGLWVGEQTGKSKEFRLELAIGQLGQEEETTVSLGAGEGGEGGATDVAAAAPAPSPPEDEEVAPATLDEAALRHVLGASDIEPLMGLGENGDVTAEHEKGLVDHLAVAAGIESSLQADPLADDAPVVDPTLNDATTALGGAAAALDGTAAAGDNNNTTVDGTVAPLDGATTVDAAAIDTTAIPQISTPQQAVAKPWATFASDPLAIVSKPSQKTAKARSMASCLSNTDAFALYVRVNGQTVRTKYMTLDHDDNNSNDYSLSARPGKWSPFRFEVLYRAAPPEPEDKNQRTRFKLDLDREHNIITYGSIVQLVEVQSGVRSDPLRLVRVDKNEVTVGADTGHPVSELQRVGLVRVIDGVDDTEGGSRWYLSAPGAVTGAGEVKPTRARPGKTTKAIAAAPPLEAAEALGVVPTNAEASTSAAPIEAAITDAAPPVVIPETLGGLENFDAAIDVSAHDTPEATPPVAGTPTTTGTRKRKTKRHALAHAAINEEEQGSTAAGLNWHLARRRDEDRVVGKPNAADARTQSAVVETVDDWMCWVLTGVWCFSYSFFNGQGDADPLPKAPIDPIPRLLVDPVYHADSNSLDLTLSYFFMPDIDPTTGLAGAQQQPLSVYLGPIGPLRVTTWRSSAPKEKYYDPGALYPALPFSGNAVDTNVPMPEGRRVFSNYPYSVPHVIAMVELPPVDEVIRVMEENAPVEVDANGASVAAVEAAAAAAAAVAAEAAAATVTATMATSTVTETATEAISAAAGAPDTTITTATTEPELPTAASASAAEDNSWFGVMGASGELTIQEALRNAGKHHGSDHEHDVGAVLSGHDDETGVGAKEGGGGGADEFGIEQLGNSLIDPTLHDAHHEQATNGAAAMDVDVDVNAVDGGGDVQVPTTAETAHVQPEKTTTTPPSALALHAPERVGTDTLPALPLLVVRHDGVGHSTGWSVAASRTAGATGAARTSDEEGAWGLRVVQTSACGQTPAW